MARKLLTQVPHPADDFGFNPERKTAAAA